MGESVVVVNRGRCVCGFVNGNHEDFFNFEMRNDQAVGVAYDDVFLDISLERIVMNYESDRFCRGDDINRDGRTRLGGVGDIRPPMLNIQGNKTRR